MLVPTTSPVRNKSMMSRFDVVLSPSRERRLVTKGSPVKVGASLKAESKPRDCCSVILINFNKPPRKLNTGPEARQETVNPKVVKPVHVSCFPDEIKDHVHISDPN